MSSNPKLASSPPPIIPSSPTARRSSTSTAAADSFVPLDSPLRTTPVHSSISSIKLPTNFDSQNLNPLTLQAFTEAELKQYGYEKLRNELPNKDEIERVRDETIKLLKEKMEDREAKAREIDREIEEKEKIREVERKVYRKKMGGGKDG